MADPSSSGDTPPAPPTGTQPPAAPPADPQGGQPPTSTTPPATDGGDKGGQQQPDMVPSSRLHEETELRRKAEERLAEIETEREAGKAQPQGDDVEIDPDVQKILDTYAKKHGFVTQEELDRVKQDAEVRVQVQQDVAELKSQYSDYDHNKVLAFAKEKQMPITSKTALEAAYVLMNRDSILETERKRAVAEFQEGSKSGGEKPGPGGAKAPEQPKPTSLRERISAARGKLQTQ